MKITFLIFLFLTFASVGFAQTEADREAIKRTALSYAEGWYEGDSAKMESALSSELVKRIVRTNAQGQSGLGPMSALALVQATRQGSGKETPKEQQQQDVTILDVFGNAATVKLEMRDLIDYMHIGKMNGKWVILNVLWETKPVKAAVK